MPSLVFLKSEVVQMIISPSQPISHNPRFVKESGNYKGWHGRNIKQNERGERLRKQIRRFCFEIEYHRPVLPGSTRNEKRTQYKPPYSLVRSFLLWCAFISFH